MMIGHRRPYSFEYKFFRGLMYGSLVFWIYRLAVSMYTRDISLLWADLTLLSLSILIIYFTRHGKYFNWTRILYCLALVAGFVFYWQHIGGIDGPVTYVYFALITIFVILLPFRFRAMFSVLLGTVAIVLALDSERSFLLKIDPMSDWTEKSIPHLYIMATSVVAVLVVTLKWHFDQEKRLLEKKNAHLDQVNNELSLKVHDLLVQKEEIESIKENLELFVTERTVRLENRHQKLEEYAYNNAHVIRRYLSNIIGLLDVIELERDQHTIDQHALQEIRQNAHELDLLIRKVNTILN